MNAILRGILLPFPAWPLPTVSEFRLKLESAEGLEVLIRLGWSSGRGSLAVEVGENTGRYDLPSEVHARPVLTSHPFRTMNHSTRPDPARRLSTPDHSMPLNMAKDLAQLLIGEGWGNWWARFPFWRPASGRGRRRDPARSAENSQVVAD